MSDDTGGRPRGRTDVILRPLDEEWVLYDPKREQLHVVNRTAALIWAHCTGEETVGQIVAALRDVFEGQVPPERLAADVREALASFRERGLFA